MIRGAKISDDEQYRYWLLRRWGPGKMCGFVLLNPSTADHLQDDPTIRRCIGFAKRESCSAVVVLNLFAFRATDPDVMKAQADPVGELNNMYIRKWAMMIDGPFIAGWGNHGLHRNRAAEVKSMFPLRLQALGVNLTGEPQHPLYIANDAPLVDF